MGFVVIADPLLREAEIGYPNVTLGVQKDVLGFQISVDYVLGMQTTNCFYHFCSVQFSPLFAELALLAEVGEEFSSVEEVDEEVELGFGLESVAEANDVRVLDFLEDVSLSLGLDQQILLNELVLLQDLHCVGLAAVFLAHQINFTERTSSNHFQHREVMQRYFGPWKHQVLRRLVSFRVVVLVEGAFHAFARVEGGVLHSVGYGSVVLMELDVGEFVLLGPTTLVSH
mmetsp:Transcript_32189/g.49219  ORF Transcript_32189/g.49219 Transcript_32189/m.49219 type:complete len:228 (+) Transcript_32189:573-1256(+)|eukprot:CAMPEP_0170479246 /NCGR_PEP_ID=MMETSP0208-20121228/551_1 /TAXON_ID=197538 /ORGANISM="Strombidium inclinatum, Strain S3" /LENGTH=227 /DNA_ID=CAMNT_0010751607 /DNA_START=561 /DNA_END=1244 /DNA_ORIENTATION=-